MKIIMYGFKRFLTVLFQNKKLGVQIFKQGVIVWQIGVEQTRR